MRAPRVVVTRAAEDAPTLAHALSEAGFQPVVVPAIQRLYCIDEVAELAAGVDVLVYEAMRFEKIRQRPPHLQFILDYHADTPRIGMQAAELGVPTLVLTHLIPPPESDDDVQAFVDDIRTAGFAGELVVAEDLSQVTLG